MSQNNNSLRGGNSSAVITGATSNVLRVVENQLRPYASDDNDPSNKYITTVKYNTTEYWESIPDYIPGEGEFVVYSDCHEVQIDGETVYVPDIKIGDGETRIEDLPFISDYNSGGEIFWTTYGETTYGEIIQASSQEKKVCCKYNSMIYDLVYAGDSCVFACTDNIVSPAIVRFLRVETSNSWSSTDTGALATAASIVVERGSGTDSIQQKGTSASAISRNSAAFGYNTKAQNRSAFAEGENTSANGSCSHAEGYGSMTGGNANGAHAEGQNTQARGEGSHTEGNDTRTLNSYEHAEGSANISIADVTRHTVGIGAPGVERKNAHTITRDGKHYIPGVGGYTGEENTEALLNSRQDLASVINSKVEGVFIAMAYSTSFTDIKTAIDAGREVLCLGSGGYAHLAEKTSNYIVFTILPNSGYNGASRKFTVDSNNNWTDSFVGFELDYDTTNKKLRKSYGSSYIDVVTAVKIVEDGAATANLISQSDFNAIFD